MTQTLYFRTTREGNNPEGLSILRPCWRSWRYKRELERIEAVGLQRALMGTPVIKLEQGATNYTTAGSQSDEYRARQLISDLHGNRLLGVVEDSYLSFRFETPKMQGITSDSGSVIKRKDEDIARAILAMFIMLGSQEQGSWALSRELADIFFLGVDGYLNAILEVINRDAVPVLMRWNGMEGEEAYPYLHGTVNRRIDLETVTSVINDLVGQQVIRPDPTLEDYVRRLAGLPAANPVEVKSVPEDPTTEEVETEEDSVGLFAVESGVESRYRGLDRVYKQRLDEAVLAWSRVARDDLLAIPKTEVSPARVTETWGRSVEKLDTVKNLGWEYIPRAVTTGYRSGGLPPELRVRVDEEIGVNDGYINNRLKPITAARMDRDTAVLLVPLLLGDDEEGVEAVVAGLTAVVRRHAALYAGQVWHAVYVGATHRVRGIDGPYRWVADPLARHCTECPAYAGRLYPTIEELLATTGGVLPGSGTECDGGCRCHLEHETPSGWTWL